MREILFRGKLLNTEKWIQGFYCAMEATTYAVEEDYKNYPVPTHHCIAVDEMTDWGLPNKLVLYEVDSATVGQFTGLTDKNGKKIFEGDIIKLLKCENDVCTLKDDNPNYYFQGKNGRYEISEEPHNPECFEVIGNIYDNPELLEAPQEDTHA